MQTMNPLQKLEDFGQSPWLDFIRRQFLEEGNLTKLVHAHEVKGVTSNPAIFEQAIARSNDYDNDIIMMTGEGLSAMEIYDALSIKDVSDAADIMRPVYDESKGLDGYVSLEVSPHLAHDKDQTVLEGLRLFNAINKPNIMIKVPATLEGVEAFGELITAGVPVNVTLLFSVERYKAVAEAYIDALKKRHEQNLPLNIASVASFFVSRVDTMVDPILENHENPMSKELLGEIAIANSRLAYRVFESLFSPDNFSTLHEAGASVQRLLWASTSTKNPDYSKVKYVDALVGPATVNTIPLETLNDYREMGDPEDRLSGTAFDAEITLSKLDEFGIDIEEVASQLEKEGIEKFVQPFDKLIESIENKRQSIVVG